MPEPKVFLEQLMEQLSGGTDTLDPTQAPYCFPFASPRVCVDDQNHGERKSPLTT
jgi:hypothetical protein